LALAARSGIRRRGRRGQSYSKNIDPVKPSTNPALERDALYAKSQVYIYRGLRSQADGDIEEYQLWASLALELLGKSALAKVHPALVADPTHYESLFAACGRQLSPDIKTISAKTLFQRLAISKRLLTRGIRSSVNRWHFVEIPSFTLESHRSLECRQKHGRENSGAPLKPF
jgi:hypothetical protein